jgi:hypothetical protein
MSVKLDTTENNINTGDLENVFCRILVSWDVMLLGWVKGSRYFREDILPSYPSVKVHVHFLRKEYRCMRQYVKYLMGA